MQVFLPLCCGEIVCFRQQCPPAACQRQKILSGLRQPKLFHAPATDKQLCAHLILQGLHAAGKRRLGIPVLPDWYNITTRIRPALIWLALNITLPLMIEIVLSITVGMLILKSEQQRSSEMQRNYSDSARTRMLAATSRHISCCCAVSRNKPFQKTEYVGYAIKVQNPPERHPFRTQQIRKRLTAGKPESNILDMLQISWKLSEPMVLSLWTTNMSRIPIQTPASSRIT